MKKFLILLGVLCLCSCSSNIEEGEYYYYNATYVSDKSEEEYFYITKTNVKYVLKNEEQYNYEYRTEKSGEYAMYLFHNYTYLLTARNDNKKQVSNGCYMFTLKE